MYSIGKKLGELLQQNYIYYRVIGVWYPYVLYIIVNYYIELKTFSTIL